VTAKVSRYRDISFHQEPVLEDQRNILCFDEVLWSVWFIIYDDHKMLAGFVMTAHPIPQKSVDSTRLSKAKVGGERFDHQACGSRWECDHEKAWGATNF